MRAVGQLTVLGGVIVTRGIVLLSTTAVEQQHLAGLAATRKQKPGRWQGQLEVIAFYRQRTLGRGPERVIAIEGQRKESVAAPVWRPGGNISFACGREVGVI